MELPAWRKNIKLLRKQLGLNQAQLALRMNITDKTISNWETGISMPNLDEVEALCKILGVSFDGFFENVHLNEKKQTPKKRQDVHLNVHPSVHLNEENSGLIKESKTVFFTGKMPAVVTVDHGGIDNIIYVPVKARAGYLLGYGDPTFIETLPSFRMPGLDTKTYRMFEVDGISMAPTLSDKDRVICEWVPSLSEIRENRVHFIVHKNGIVIKRVLNRVTERNKLYLKSDTLTHRSDYPLIELDPEDILEIWYVRLKVSSDLREPSEVYTRLSDLEILTHEIAKKLNLKP